MAALKSVYRHIIKTQRTLLPRSAVNSVGDVVCASSIDATVHLQMAVWDSFLTVARVRLVVVRAIGLAAGAQDVPPPPSSHD